MMKKLRKGQSTLEYVIILVAVVGAIIIAGGIIKGRIWTGYDTLSLTMKDKIEAITYP